VYRVAGVVYGIGLLGVTHDLRRQVRWIGALDALPEVQVGAACHSLLDSGNQGVWDVPGHDRAVDHFLRLAPVRRSKLRVDPQQGADTRPLRRLPARVEQVEGHAVIGQHGAVTGQDAAPERLDTPLLVRVLD